MLYGKLCHTETQTEKSIKDISKESEDFPKEAVLLDHSYCFDRDNIQGSEVSECVEDVKGQTRKSVSDEYSDTDCETEDSDTYFSDFHIRDSDYAIDHNISASGSSSEGSTDDNDIKLCKAQKFIVFDEMLDRLLYALKCPFCSGAVDSVHKSCVGTMLRATVICTAGHEVMKWTSQPTIRQAPVGNILGAAAILFSGNTLC